ncbi:MAG: hypothetical protein LLG01_02785 [Planctomycetaceae bacterium]|nr:hypothetical protein [Planctomycetaceae bacterium]
MTLRDLKERLHDLDPMDLLMAWDMAVFLAAVVQLVSLRGTLVAFIPYLFPPAFATLIGARTTRPSSAIVSALFMALIAAGILIARVDWLFPHMVQTDDRLSSTANRILSWYGMVFISFAMGILPAFLFIRGLVDRYRGKKAQFTRFTCILGLIATLLSAAFLPDDVMHTLGIRQADRPSAPTATQRQHSASTTPPSRLNR